MINDTITHTDQTHLHSANYPEHAHCTVHPFKSILWTAILAGALVGVGLGFLLNLFGIAIGLSAFTLNNGAYALAIGGLLGILIGIIASMLAAGYTAGYLGRLYNPNKKLGILYGFLTWTLSLLLGAVLAAHTSDYFGSYTRNNVNGPISVSTQNNKATPTANIQSTGSPTNPALNVHIDAAPKHLAWTAFLIFALFFIGAISTCIGASWGMSCCHKEE